MAKKAKKGHEDDETLDETAEGADESEDEGDEDEAPKAKKKAKGKDKAKAKSKAKDSDEDDGYVTIADLAEEAEINGQSARVKLREAEMEKPEGGRWRWKEGSKGLKAARKALGL